MCGDLDNLNKNMRVVANALRAQNRINFCLLGMNVITGVLVYKVVNRHIEQEEQIESLTKEVEELKKSKGE